MTISENRHTFSKCCFFCYNKYLIGGRRIMFKTIGLNIIKRTKFFL